MNVINITIVMAIAFTAVVFFGATPGGTDFERKISHKPLTNIIPGQKINISAEFSDQASDIETVRTFFKTNEDDRFYFITMEKSHGNTYAGVLPAALPGTRKLEYTILAKTETNEILRSSHYVLNTPE